MNLHSSVRNDSNLDNNFGWSFLDTSFRNYSPQTYLWIYKTFPFIQLCKKMRDLNNFFNPAILLLHHLPAVVGQVLQLLLLLVQVVPGNSMNQS